MEQISVGRRNCQAHYGAEIDSHNAMLVQWAYGSDEMLNAGSNISSRISRIEGDGNCRSHRHGPNCSGVSHFPFLLYFSMRI